MKKLLRILGTIVVLAGAFLVILKTTTRFTPAQPTTTLANPASVYCKQQSGTLEIVTDASGAQSGICHVTGGVDCEEWAYFRGECSVTGAVELTGTEELTGVQLPDEIITTITTDQGYITEAYTSGGKNYIKIDYTEDGPMGDGGAPEIINNNPLIRIFEVANTATFEVLKNVNGGPEPITVSRNEFKTRGNSNRTTLNPNANNPIYYGASDTSIVKIDHDAQKVYKVTETYRP